MGRQNGNPESRQFGSFSSSAKSGIASTRHCFFQSSFLGNFRKTITISKSSGAPRSDSPQTHSKIKLAFREVGSKTPEASRPAPSQICSNKRKSDSRMRFAAIKFHACGNITICFGLFLRTVVTAVIAQAQERYRCSVHKHDSICVTTGQGSRCSQRKSCTSNRSSTSCFGFCAVTPIFVT